MAQVVIYFATVNNTVFEVDLLAGTYYGFNSWDKLVARQEVLSRAEIPYANWDFKGKPESTLGFGIDITYLKENLDKLSDTNAGNTLAKIVWGRDGLVGKGYFPVDGFNSIWDILKSLDERVNKLLEEKKTD